MTINIAAAEEFLCLLQRTGSIVFIVFPQDPAKPCIHVYDLHSGSNITEVRLTRTCSLASHFLIHI